jgi:hypothetical protein
VMSSAGNLISKPASHADRMAIAAVFREMPSLDTTRRDVARDLTPDMTPDRGRLRHLRGRESASADSRPAV